MKPNNNPNWDAIKDKEVYVQCEQCKSNHAVKSLSLHTDALNIRGVQLRLTYWRCPKCQKLYPVMLEDKSFALKQLEFTNVKTRIGRIVKMGKKVDPALLKRLQRLKTEMDKYQLELKHRFMGDFNLIDSQLKAK